MPHLFVGEVSLVIIKFTLVVKVLVCLMRKVFCQYCVIVVVCLLRLFGPSGGIGFFRRCFQLFPLLFFLEF